MTSTDLCMLLNKNVKIMKRLLFMFVLTAVMCGCKSNEDKALELIETELFNTLYDFDSYSPIETIVTEAKSSALNDLEVYIEIQTAIQTLEKIYEINEEAENVKSSMEIWGPPTLYSSSYSDSQYYKYKDEYTKIMEEGLLYFETFNSLVRRLYDTIRTFDESSIIGWEVRHRFRCKTRGGQSTIGDYRYIIDSDFKNIILYEDIDDKKYSEARELVEAILNGEFGLKETINAESSQDWLAQIEKMDGVNKTESGLLYRIDRMGNMTKATSDTDKVLVNYEGKTLDGQVFDSSYERGEPMSFPLNMVIAGWTEGVKLIGEGGQITLWIPSKLAYGERGAGDEIGPNQALEFKIELIKVNP